jgi:hypothetical protein
MFFFCSHKVNPRCRGATYSDTFYCVETGTQKLSCLLESKLRNEFSVPRWYNWSWFQRRGSFHRSDLAHGARDRPLVSPRLRVLEAHSGTKFILK